MMRILRSRSLRASVASLFLAASCGGGAETVAGTAADSLLSLRNPNATLVSCPASATATSTSLIGPLGGLLEAGGVRVEIPANAVLLPTSFTLTVPAGKLLEFDVTTSTSEHYLFSLPVVASIDYSRCGPSLNNKALTVWNIDPGTKALLENMGGVDNKLLRVITFVTTHFSGYAVAD